MYFNWTNGSGSGMFSLEEEVGFQNQPLGLGAFGCLPFNKEVILPECERPPKIEQNSQIREHFSSSEYKIPKLGGDCKGTPRGGTIVRKASEV